MLRVTTLGMVHGDYYKQLDGTRECVEGTRQKKVHGISRLAPNGDYYNNL